MSSRLETRSVKALGDKSPGGIFPLGDSHIKGTGVLVVPFRGVREFNPKRSAVGTFAENI